MSLLENDPYHLDPTTQSPSVTPTLPLTLQKPPEGHTWPLVLAAPIGYALLGGGGGSFPGTRKKGGGNSWKNNGCQEGPPLKMAAPRDQGTPNGGWGRGNTCGAEHGAVPGDEVLSPILWEQVPAPLCLSLPICMTTRRAAVSGTFPAQDALWRCLTSNPCPGLRGWW